MVGTRGLTLRICRGKGWRWVRPGWLPAALLVFSCDSDAPKILESHQEASLRDGTSRSGDDPEADPENARSEREKVARLIARVRGSGVVFIRNGRKQNSAEAAAHLQSEFAKAERLEDAGDFIEQVANRAALSGKPYQVRQGDEAPVPAHAWLHAQLAAIEDGDGSGEGTKPEVQAQGPAGTEGASRALTINDVLAVVERSGLKFVAPQRKGSVKVYAPLEFSQMLRQKWRWIGRDITSVERFLDEIATNAFTSMEPYRVRHPDGREEQLRSWLDRKVRSKREALAVPEDDEAP